MNDHLLQESLIRVAEAATRPPLAPPGRVVPHGTLHRWTTKGCRGIVLETLHLGGRRYTSTEAVQRFHLAINQVETVGS